MTAGRPVGGDRRALTLALTGAVVTGSGSTLMHLAGSAPATAAFFRSLFALPFLAVLAARSRRCAPRRRVALPLGAAVLAGALLAADLLLWQKAVLTLGAGLSTVVQNTQVVYVAGAGWLFFGERVPARLLRFLPVLVAGVAVIAFGAPGVGDAPPAAGPSAPVVGTVLALVSALAYAGFLVVLRGRLSQPAVRARALLVVTGSTAAVSAAVGAATGGLNLTPGWTPAGWLAVLALTSQVLGWTVLMKAISRLGSLRAALVLLVQPVAALVWAAVVLGEEPSTWQTAGLALVLVAVAAMTLPAAGQTGRPPMTLARSITRTEGQ